MKLGDRSQAKRSHHQQGNGVARGVVGKPTTTNGIGGIGGAPPLYPQASPRSPIVNGGGGGGGGVKQQQRLPLSPSGYNTVGGRVLPPTHQGINNNNNNSNTQQQQQQQQRARPRTNNNNNAATMSAALPPPKDEWDKDAWDDGKDDWGPTLGGAEGG